MRDLITVDERDAGRTPAVVALERDAPPAAELFAFMAEAERRFESLRMRIADRTQTARGERIETLEVTVQHPGRVRLVSRRGENELSRDYDVWLSDGQVVTAYDADANTATVRRIPQRVAGATDQSLPSFARVWVPRTALPADTLADAFIHPRGFCRNVLSTGPLSWLDTRTLAGHREALVLRVDHPRTSHLLTDRPDHSLEVGVDRMTGLILLLEERIGARVTRRAEVTHLELDPMLPEATFRLHLSADVRMLY